MDGKYLRKLEIYNGKLLKCEIYQEKWKKKNVSAMEIIKIEIYQGK